MSEREGCFLQTMNCGCIVVVAIALLIIVALFIAVSQ